jgi:lysophospholipase L1-like esterase
MKLRYIFYGLLILILVYVAIFGLRIIIFARRGGQLINQTNAYQQLHSNEGKKILFIGDSLAYGTGASSSKYSLAGLVGRRFPEAKLVNLGQNGLRTNALADEVQAIEHGWDLIVVIVGGNDVIRPWIDLDKSANNLEIIFSELAVRADNVIALTTSNLKNTSFFLWPVNHYFGARSVQMRDGAESNASKVDNLVYVDMVTRNEHVDFGDIQEAKDHLHLSDEGYKYWYDGIVDATNNFNF